MHLKIIDFIFNLFASLAPVQVFLIAERKKK
jgi:hypothetical protein